jgi:Amt family ammonium transporter
MILYFCQINSNNMRKIVLSILTNFPFSSDPIFNFIFCTPIPAEAVAFDTGDTAWMIVATGTCFNHDSGLGSSYGGW